MKLNLVKLLNLIALTIIIASCQKEISSSKIEIEKTITKQPIEQQYAYVRDNFKKIMNELAPLFRDPLFIDYIYLEAAKKLDGENKVLIKTIVENPEYKNRINYDRIQFALNAFKGLDGVDYYPKMYFPFFDSWQSNRNNRSSEAPYAEGTEIVFYDGDESVTTVPIYIFTYSADELVLTDRFADEEYAETHPLVIIAIDEDQDEGEIFNPENPGEIEQTTVLKNFRIQNLTIKDGKESWLGGKSEVRIKSLSTTWSHIENGNTSGNFVTIPNLHYVNNYQGHLIKNVPRGEVGYPIYNINYPMEINWDVSNYFQDAIVYTYVIFEYDPWPSGIKVIASQIHSAPNPNYQQDYIIFRSHNSPYGFLPGTSWQNQAIYGNVSGSPSNNYQYLYYDGYHVNTNDIEFNTVDY